jgi:signal transduction histidine kinase/ligand-binding sensor domain-containing protein
MPQLRLLLAVFCLLFGPAAHAFEFGEPYFESVGDAESIPDNNVTALAQDPTGFIWIGTTDGLIRYDGYRYRYFGNHPDDPISLGGDLVRCLLSTPDGHLWVGTNADGVSVYDPALGTFKRFREGDADGAAISDNTVRALAQDASGAVYIGTREGLDVWDPASGQIRRMAQDLPAGSGPDDQHVSALLVDRRGELWVGSWNGLRRRVKAGQPFERMFTVADGSSALDGAQIQTMIELADGRIAFGTARRGSFIVDPQAMALTRIPVDTAAPEHTTLPSVLAILETKPGTLWLGVFGGIDVVDAETHALLQQIRPDPAIPSSLAHDQIRALLRDRSGQIWIGGYGGGLQRHDPLNDSVRVLRHSPSRAQTLSLPSISSVLERDNGELWLGTRGNGIDVYVRGQGVVRGYRPNADDPHALRSGVVSSLAQTRDGSIWAGTLDGLHRFALDSLEISRVNDPSIPNSYIRRLVAGNDGDLWIGTDAGLAHWLPSAPTLERIDAADGTPVREDINAIAQAADGRLWVGSSVGLYTRDPGGKGLQRVHARTGATDLPHPTVIGLLIDRSGKLWIDTASGLCTLENWDGEYAQFAAISTGIGIGGQPFGANLLEDAAGRIWTQRFRYDPKDHSLYEFSRADGADLGTPWFRSYVETRDGLLLFGGSKGLMVVDPARFQPWTEEPPIVATELRVGGVARQFEHLDAGFELTPKQRSFSLEFAALDFSAPARNRYAYRLDPFDADWISTDANHRVASYNSLNPGDYTLRVRGSGRNGVFGPDELEVPIKVLPAYWQTPWFQLLMALAGMLVVVAAVRLQSARIRRKAQQLQKLVDRRTAELMLAKEGAEVALQHLQTAQRELVAREKMASLGQLVAGVAHEINTPVGVALTASSFLGERSEALQKQLQQGQLSRSDLSSFISQAFEASAMIGSNLARASDLVRSFKQVSVDRSSDDRRRFNLSECLKSVVNSLQLTWKRRPVQLELHCPPDIEMESFPGALGQVITNLIQNALFHAFSEGRPGTMQISAWRVKDTLIALRFVDDGDGISAEDLARIFEPFYTTKRAQGGSGLGLHIVYNLVTVQLGGQIEAHGAPGAGMRFEITLPLVAPT